MTTSIKISTARAKMLPKSYERFKKLLPYDGFCVLKAEDFKEMMKIIHNEPDEKLKHTYFTQVLDKLFACGWGWYMRLGESLSAMSRYEYASQLPAKKRAVALSVLRMVKDMHIELKYKPNYIPFINQFIREFGGTTLNPAEKEQQKKAKFNSAVATMEAGGKLPRKLKKKVGAVMQKTR